MFCNYCGKTIQEDANVCAYCGRVVGVRVITRPPLVRARAGRKIAGICLGMAHHLGVDATLMRIIVIFLTIIFPPTLIVYIIAWIVMPEEPEVVIVPASVQVTTPPRV